MLGLHTFSIITIHPIGENVNSVNSFLLSIFLKSQLNISTVHSLHFPFKDVFVV